MDTSALIFVALAVAWAVYLIPKALQHHDEAVRSRSVDKFSHTMRVLARREPVDHRNARLVVAPLRADRRPAVETKARTTPTPIAAPVRRQPTPGAARAVARSAARRRRNVLSAILLILLVVATLAATSVVAWPWVAAPAGLLLAWLVACRLSVKAERLSCTGRDAADVDRPVQVDDTDATDSTGAISPVPDAVEVATAPPVDATSSDAAEVPAVLTGEIPIIAEMSGGWDMVPTTLPTYVTKPTAQRRSVQTIDLDSTGVWSSGHNDGDSALARSAERVEKVQKAARDAEDARRVSGA